MEHTKELIEMAHRGNKKARDMLVLENMGLVYSIARRFFGRGYDMEDITQIGTIGLIKAIDKFDLEQPVMFSTYAVPMISGEIKRFIRDDGMIKVSRSIKENGFKIRQAAEELSKKYGRDATVDELCGKTGLAPEEIVLAIEAGRDVESIYQTVYQGDENQIYIVDKLSAATENTPNDVLINHMMLEQVIDRLSDTEQQLIRMRYYQDKTQTEVADRLGISQVQVSRMEKKILQRMRNAIEY